MKNNLFRDLFIFEVANNHQGDIKHGLRIVSEMGRIAREARINAAVKFQYRELETFLHPDLSVQSQSKHSKRFQDTKLLRADFSQLLDACRNEGLRTIVTPFDEASVDHCLDDGVDVLKIASCSANDWPLLESIADARRPTILSTGGLNLSEIDAAVSFFLHRKIELAVLHCVGVYPMPSELAGLQFMERLIRRYPMVPIGWSGHESPEDLDVVKVAVAKGATILERHVGIETPESPLNQYSMNVSQTVAWVKAALLTKSICGDGVKQVSQSELESLRSLKRGVYAKLPIKKGDLITRDHVSFHMPCLSGQLTSGEFGRYRVKYFASKDYEPMQPICEFPISDEVSSLRSIIHDVKGMLYEARIALGDEVEVELSHHYGIKQFRRTGAVIVNVINRNYCKKLIVLLPGQKHPVHWHKLKEETFQVLYGSMEVIRDGECVVLLPGDKMLVEPGVKHSFRSDDGVIFEEISTTHIRNDSFYEDENIQRLDPLERKTILKNW